MPQSTFFLFFFLGWSISLWLLLLRGLVVLRQLNFLKTLTYSVVEFDKLVEAIASARLLFLRYFSECKIMHTVHEAHLGQFVVVQNEILEMFDFSFPGHGDERASRMSCACKLIGTACGTSINVHANRQIAIGTNHMFTKQSDCTQSVLSMLPFGVNAKQHFLVLHFVWYFRKILVTLTKNHGLTSFATILKDLNTGNVDAQRKGLL